MEHVDASRLSEIIHYYVESYLRRGDYGKSFAVEVIPQGDRPVDQTHGYGVHLGGKNFAIVASEQPREGA